MGRTAVLRIALLVAGGCLLAATLALCLAPGPLGACGSLLAPMFPLRVAARCPASQSTYVMAAAVTALVGLGALVAGTIVRPPRRRRRHHHHHHR
jgi:hypothetical protein